MKVIIGAGLAGMICGAMNAQAKIFERNNSSFVGHRAVLRFRDDKIANSIGIPFRKVRVRKGIWADGARQPAPYLANAYSLKVRGIVGEASIWNLDPSDRYIAPPDLHARLAEICGSRVEWEHTVDLQQILSWREEGKMIVNTSPLPRLLDMIGMVAPFEFEHAPIRVDRYTIQDCDVFQTVYFPDPSIPLYRATLTGSLLTLESTAQEAFAWTSEDTLRMALDSFGVTRKMVEAQETVGHRQQYGKIVPVEDGPRKALLHHLTQEWGIYSLGRFATWRNILLDDVFVDIAQIRKMMGQRGYDLELGRMKG